MTRRRVPHQPHRSLREQCLLYVSSVIYQSSAIRWVSSGKVEMVGMIWYGNKWKNLHCGRDLGQEGETLPLKSQVYHRQLKLKRLLRQSTQDEDEVVLHS
uniref:Uncharacterized protein n=1 Tax=Cacopsylla melanoneura TaxID=428564 RepID=A0A8D8Z6N4_9HEMI